MNLIEVAAQTCFCAIKSIEPFYHWFVWQKCLMLSEAQYLISKNPFSKELIHFLWYWVSYFVNKPVYWIRIVFLPSKQHYACLLSILLWYFADTPIHCCAKCWHSFPVAASHLTRPFKSHIWQLYVCLFQFVFLLDSLAKSNLGLLFTPSATWDRKPVLS